MIPSGWLYRDAFYLVAEMDVDARAARRWVPRPLGLVDRAGVATASVFTAWFPDTAFGSGYREAGLLLPVRHGRTRAVFSPWMIVDDDVALILGRELLGYPKKMGEIEFVRDGDAVRSVATRRGSELVRMEGTLGEVLADPPPMLGTPHRCVRASLGVALPKIVAFTPKEEAVEVRRATLTVTIGGSERDPLTDLGFGPVRAARLHRVNLGGRRIPFPVAVASPLWLARQLLLRVH
jgi:acetoacetate decarboxylase